jgi:hypothetical protein
MVFLKNKSIFVERYIYRKQEAVMAVIYLIESNQEGSVTYKIGYSTRKARNRKKELSTGNAGKLRVIHEYKTEYPHELEIALHNHFSYCRLEGEWFSEDLNIEKFIPTCNTYDKAILAVKSAA